MTPYQPSNREVRDQAAVRHYFRLLDAQDKEVKDDMVKFDAHNEDKYHIRILDDSHGYLVVLIRLREKGTPLYCLRFRKKPKQGIVYNFRKADSLWRLYIDADLFPELLLPLPEKKPVPLSTTNKGESK